MYNYEFIGVSTYLHVCVFPYIYCVPNSFHGYVFPYFCIFTCVPNSLQVCVFPYFCIFTYLIIILSMGIF